MADRLGGLFDKFAKHRSLPMSAFAAKSARLALHKLNAMVQLRACTSVGADPRVVGRVRVDNAGRITVGDNVRLSSEWSPIELVTGPSGVLEIGDGTEMNYGALLSASSRVTLGKKVMIGNYCIVADTEVPGAVGTPGGGQPHDITIGDEVWLAVRVTVLPGTRIGARSVITAGSVVSGTIPEGVVAGGIPARVLRAVEPGPPR